MAWFISFVTNLVGALSKWLGPLLVFFTGKKQGKLEKDNDGLRRTNGILAKQRDNNISSVGAARRFWMRKRTSSKSK